MKLFETNLNGHKLTKTLPKVWKTSDKDTPKKELFVLEDFSMYLTRLYDSLIGIKTFYEKEFNDDNIYTIDEYISLFNVCYKKILRNLITNKKTLDEMIKEQVALGRDRDKNARFSVLTKIPKYSDCFERHFNKVKGFTDEVYEKISKYAKQLFMIEKICSFTTRKFWAKEITKADELDLKKNYKILIKCVFPYSWRDTNRTKKINNYMKSRIFHSTSLIDERHFYSTFLSYSKHYAMLLIDYNDEDFVCASPTDSYSEEVIDNHNMISDKMIFSDVLLQSDENIDDINHKFFAEAVECETPKNLLNNIKFYTEVNFKNIKPKAVIAPNKESLEFAEQLAEEYGDLPVISKYEVK